MQTNIISGSDGHFSPGDDLHIRRADGSIFRLTTRGDYGPKDWSN